MAKTIQHNPQEAGSALIVVLTVLAVLTLMVAQLTANSEIAAREAQAAATRSSLRYSAESASERAFWMLLADRRQFRSRAVGVMQPEELAEQPRWQADGAKHRLAYGDHEVAITLLDANSGIDVSGVNPGGRLLTFLLPDAADLDQLETVRRFLDVLVDYIDDRERITSRLHGKTPADYAAEGWPDMPRMGALQMREELFWIDGIESALAILGDTARPDQLMASIRLIPPPGRAFPESGKPSFFSSNPLLVRQLSALSSEGLQELMVARDEWRESGGDFFSHLDPGLSGRLRENHSFVESSVVTIVAEASCPKGTIKRELRTTRHLSQFIQPRGTTRAVENWQKVLE